jgi:LmbE family N-acetylglucosaminyl deacetylase
MLAVPFPFPHRNVPRILCLGAHCDDIPIGCGGTLLHLADQCPKMEVTWVVMSSTEIRESEEQAAAKVFIGNASANTVVIKRWRDGFLPDVWKDVKEFFEELKQEVEPDLIFTHYRDDRHQDHRLVNELTWNTFRNHFILEYEIPKYDGDFGSPNVFVPLSDSTCRKKARGIIDCYPSQKGKQWFDEEIFVSLARLRGMEAGRESPFAEGFYSRKLLLA